jgi:hypothetical protein
MNTQEQAQVYSLQRYRQTKNVLEANVRSFIRHGDPQRRQAMHTVLNAVLSNHNRNHMSFRSFDVFRTDGGYVFIRAKKHASGDICPGCEHQLRYSDMTLIQVEDEGFAHDMVVWGCKHCQEVFSRIEYTGGGLDA